MQNESDVHRDILLRHARHPKKTQDLTHEDSTGQCHNPLCGDRVSVGIIVHENMIKNIRIRPSGCSISVAGASLMALMVEGLTIDQTEDMIKQVFKTLVPTPNEEASTWPQELITLAPLRRLRENTMKIPCALISWVAIEDAVKNFKKRF